MNESLSHDFRPVFVFICGFRRSQARVADALDDADRRRNDRKFEHQWNYREHVG